MANVFEVLRRDHERIRHLLAEIEAGPAQVGLSEAERMSARKRQVDRLITEESMHEALEEEYFWPAVREMVPEGGPLADQAVDQEQRAKFTLANLMGYRPGDPGSESMITRFIEEAREHLAFEEEHVWPELRLVITPRRSEELGAKVERGRRTAPTRPHPHTPPHPGLLKATSPFVGTADRIRDLVTGRSRH